MTQVLARQLADTVQEVSKSQTIAEYEERLQQVQVATELALRTLGRASHYGERVVMEGATDILTALRSQLKKPCAPPG